MTAKALEAMRVQTQTVKGGNTAEFYAREGTLPKSEMQAALHPDVSRLMWRFGRPHHYVDYRPFRANRLVRKAGVAVEAGINDYGMKRYRVEKAIPPREPS